MKIKDLVSLTGCYSAHHVGELELSEEKVKNLVDVDVEKLAKILYQISGYHFKDILWEDRPSDVKKIFIDEALEIQANLKELLVFKCPESNH